MYSVFVTLNLKDDRALGTFVADEFSVKGAFLRDAQ